MLDANNALLVEHIARGCYHVNQVYCHAIGDGMYTGASWEAVPEATRESLRMGVRMHLSATGTTPEQSHAAWLAHKTAEGWKYGPCKDELKKEHPCFMPYSQLPVEQRVKDSLFRATVHVQLAMIGE